MEIKGSQKVKASQPQVFQALLNPEVLKNSIPGCDSAEFVDFPTGRQVKLIITPNLPIPGLKGSQTIYLQTGEVIPNSRVTLITEPYNALGTIKAVCTIDLSQEADGTNLSYNAQATLEGKISATPDMIIKGAVKVALDQFFKNFEKQVSVINA
jgi:carbon monoxide dehydrogenase subunit G